MSYVHKVRASFQPEVGSDKGKTERQATQDYQQPTTDNQEPTTTTDSDNRQSTVSTRQPTYSDSFHRQIQPTINTDTRKPTPKIRRGIKTKEKTADQIGSKNSSPWHLPHNPSSERSSKILDFSQI
jgi:hypothetical protein